MMYRRLFLLLAAAQILPAQANDHLPAHPNPLTVCSPYLTETECQAHLRILSLLNDPRERAAYQAMHAQLIEERQAVCGVPADKKTRNLVSLTLAPL